MASATRVLNLLLQAREGGPIDRAKAAAAALKEFNGLDGGQKRSLAVLVAQRAAPQLVPRIEAETGLDLTPEQVRTVVDLVGQLNTGSLEELRDSVETAEASSEPLISEDQGDPEITPPERVDAAEVAAAAAEARRRLERERAAAEADARQAIAEARAEAARAREVINLARAGDESVVDGAERAEDEPVADQPVHDQSNEDASGSGEVEDSAEPASFEELLPVEDEPEKPRPPQGSERPLLPPEVLAAPDGWRRRRALLALIHNDRLPAASATAAVSSLSRPTDRVWIAASLVETGEVDLDALAPLLDERAVQRLRRRYA